MAQNSFTDVPGSDRELLPGSRLVGTPSPSEYLEVTVLIRGLDRPPEMLERGLPCLSHKEFERNYAATESDIEKITDFANTNGLDVLTINAAARTVKLGGSLVTLSEAFGVSLQLYEAGGIRYRGRQGPVRIPHSLANIIEGVFGLDNRPSARMHGAGAITGPSFTPPQIATLYNFPPGDGGGQVIALIELGGGFQSSDLNAYFQSLGIPAPTVIPVSVDGGRNSPNPQNNGSTNPDFEVTLDIQVTGAIAPGAKQLVYFAKDTSEQSFLTAVKAAIHDSVNLPSVISISWGLAESLESGQFLNAMEQAFTDAAALGITVCVAAGDNGSTDGVFDQKLHVDFPASAPHALGVGGTMVVVAGNTISAEVVWNNTRKATGGGVSDFFPLPSWQNSAGVPRSSNPGAFLGRGVPDVSANADPQTGYQIFVHNQPWTWGGTSAAAPLWAALVAIMNQNAGYRLGFLNPQLYALPNMPIDFRDITNGTNDNSGSVPPLPFNAKAGWDACTGLGSPNGVPLLLDLLTLNIHVAVEAIAADQCDLVPVSGGQVALVAWVTPGHILVPANFQWTVPVNTTLVHESTFIDIGGYWTSRLEVVLPPEAQDGTVEKLIGSVQATFANLHPLDATFQFQPSSKQDAALHRVLCKYMSSLYPRLPWLFNPVGPDPYRWKLFPVDRAVPAIQPFTARDITALRNATAEVTKLIDRFLESVGRS